MNPHDQSPDADSAPNPDQPPPKTQPKPPTKSGGGGDPARRLPKPRKKTKLSKSSATSKPPAPSPTASPTSTVITDLLHGMTGARQLLAQGSSLADRRTLQDLANALAGVEASADSTVELLVYYVREHILTEISKKQFLTNDLVDIRGGFGRFDYRVMRVNGGKPLDLDRREYILMKIFADHASERHDASPPDDDGAGLFLPVDEILRKIDALKARHAILGDVWNEATFMTIHHVICDLRKKLRAAQLNPHLIESRSNGAGYRISTRLANITLRHGSTDKTPPAP